MSLRLRKYITQLCKECEDLLSEMSEVEQLSDDAIDAIDCCYSRLYRIRYSVTPFWKKSRKYL